MSVIAKFLCTGVEKNKYYKNDPKFIYNVKLRAVYDSDPNSENAKFFAATPNGDINLGTVNEEAAEMFEPGEDYEVTFKKAAKSE